MNRIYWLILGWMGILAWTSFFMALWTVAMARIEFVPFLGISFFSILVGFFSIALAKDAWEKDTGHYEAKKK